MNSVQKRIAPALLFCVVLTVGAGVSRADGFDGTSGETPSCEANEHYCSHTVAMFSAGGVSVPSYKEGACVPKDQRCADFWCGPRHCAHGFFGTPSVCCVTANPGQTAEYRCAYSELSCPGNNDQLTIRGSAS